MNLDQYQQLAGRTDNLPPGIDAHLRNGLGLTGEAGEYAELIKKHAFHGSPLDQDKAKKELGDVLWYLARAAAAHGLTLSEVAEANIAKLRTRYPHGFTETDSAARVDLIEER